MATALHVHTPEDFSPAAEYSSPWLDRAIAPREEALSLFALVGRNVDTVESIRELIAVPHPIETALLLYRFRTFERGVGVQSQPGHVERLGEGCRCVRRVPLLHATRGYRSPCKTTHQTSTHAAIRSKLGFCRAVFRYFDDVRLERFPVAPCLVARRVCHWYRGFRNVGSTESSRLRQDEREKEVSRMNPQFWLYWIGIVTVGYIILLPGIIFLVMKRAQERQGA